MYAEYAINTDTKTNHFRATAGDDIHVHSNFDMNSQIIKNIEEAKAAKVYVNNLYTKDGDNINVHTNIDLNQNKLFNGVLDSTEI